MCRWVDCWCVGGWWAVHVDAKRTLISKKIVHFLTFGFYRANLRSFRKIFPRLSVFRSLFQKTIIVLDCTAFSGRCFSRGNEISNCMSKLSNIFVACSEKRILFADSVEYLWNTFLLLQNCYVSTHLWNSFLVNICSNLCQRTARKHRRAHKPTFFGKNNWNLVINRGGGGTVNCEFGIRHK